MESWVKQWLEDERSKGIKRLEIKYINSNYYVYSSTTFWDKKLKKRRKKSDYLGKLDPVKGLVKATKRSISCTRITSIREYGNSALLDLVACDLRELLERSFKDVWKEVYALALVRTIGYTPLKRIQSLWEKLYDIHDLNPNLNPKNLSRILKMVGLNRQSQDEIFRSLSESDRDLIYDLSVILTNSSLNFAEYGYNKDKIYIPQVNLALFCSIDTGLPTMVRLIPGSVRDIKSLYNSLLEIDTTDKTLVIDRGFFSSDVIEFLLEKKMNFVLPARRSSDYYKAEVKLGGHFFYHERLIKYGKARLEDLFIYLFEDQDLSLEETKTIYRLLDKHKKNPQKLNQSLEKAGKIIILSNLDRSEEEIFQLYKSRDRIEKLFDSYKNILEADRLYLQDNDTVFGHIFVSFLSLFAYSKLEIMLKKADIIDRYSPKDLLLEFSKIYMVKTDAGNIISDIPKKVEKLEELLKLDLFPKNRS